jgi:hypothetical protein
MKNQYGASVRHSQATRSADGVDGFSLDRTGGHGRNASDRGCATNVLFVHSPQPTGHSAGDNNKQFVRGDDAHA